MAFLSLKIYKRCNYKTLRFAILSCIVILAGSQSTFSQRDPSQKEIASFTILVETTDDGFKLACDKGCAWKSLSFSLNPYKPQAIDQFGMTTVAAHQSDSKDPNLDSFLFTIEKTKKNGVRLQSTEGTAWTELHFRGPGLHSREYISAYGMEKQKR